MKTTEKFTGKADLYAKARPDYPESLINYLVKKLNFNGSTVIADIGSGTGKLSVEFLKRNYKCFCVEPNEDMRNMAENLLAEYNGFYSVNGTEANTTLKSNSVDIVTVAQAFHWFDADKFKIECKRILKPNGYVVLIYNHRITGSDFVTENARICQEFCPNFKGFSNKLNENAINKIKFLFDNNYENVCFENNLTYSKDLFIQRMLSASYSLTEKDEKYSEYINALENLFDKYSRNGTLLLPNEAIAYFG